MTQNELVVKHIPLVRSIANKIDAQHLKDDLVGEGTVALVKCARKYDPDRGITFGSYAQHRIRGAMLSYLRKNADAAVSLDGKDVDGVPYQAKLGNDGQANLAMVKDAIQYHLHPVEEWVVTKRYFEKMRMDDIASELGFKLSRVSQIHSNAIGKLRKAFTSEPSEVEPREESDSRVNRSALLQVVRKMFWDEWGVEVSEG